MERDAPGAAAVVSPAPGRLAFPREKCVEFAVGSIARVLGAEFAAVDAFPTRVRLPADPLFFVDRILSVSGTKGGLGEGRVVTEHDVLPGAWYLDHDRVFTGIAVEAGQADLFLSAYLGIDLRTRGESTYRLLDAAVTFHGPLPRPGSVLRYDIRIRRFVRQANTHVFFFEFDGSVDGRPLITMRDGSAGFFTPRQLREGHGLVLPAESPTPESPAGRPSLAPFEGVIACDARALDALRAGDLAGAFGPLFDGLPVAAPVTLPGGRMALIDRVTALDPEGGRYGRGLVRAETDIAHDAWFLVCHFVDDQVMPGTRMFESCLQALRVFLLRRGWVADRARAAFEPMVGVRSRLKCRGQVVPGCRKATEYLGDRRSRTLSARDSAGMPTGTADSIPLSHVTIKYASQEVKMNGSGHTGVPLRPRTLPQILRHCYVLRSEACRPSRSADKLRPSV